MANFNATNVYSNSRYIVDNVTTGSPYTTVQAAINAALAAGGNASVWLRQGTYTENLTLYDGINIEGAEQRISIIIGTHVPPVAGSVILTRLSLNSGTHIFSSAAAGTTTLTCSRCRFNCTNGYVYNLTNWTGALNIHWCTDGSTANGLVYNTASSAVTMNHSLVGVGANVFTANGNVSMFSCAIGCPLLLNGTGTSLLYGGSNFTGNITTADTHLVRIALSRLSTGVTQAITHNSASTLVLDSAIVGTSNATAIGGTGTIKMVNVQFPTSNVIAGTITVSLDGVTRTAEIWAENITRMKFTGFYSWAAAGPYFDDTTLGTFQLLVGGTGYIHDQKVTWVAQNIAGMTAGNIYWIYIDSTGTIGKSSTRTDALFEDNIVLFECLRDSTTVNNQITVKENHPYSFPTAPSNYLHDVVGVVIDNTNNGANITINGTQKIQINGADVLADHGLDTTIPDSGGVAVTFRKMLTNAGGKWITQNVSDTFGGYYNNGGTATALGGGKFAVYRLYVTKDSLNTTTPSYVAVLDIVQYGSLAAANTAIANGTPAQATNELKSLELAQLGYIVFRESTAAIPQVTISKTTLKSTLSTGGTNIASLVTTVVTNFDGILSAADTNVQAALETIDEFGKNLTDHCVVVGNGNGNPLGVIGAGTTGQLLIGATGADPAFGTTAYSDFAFSNVTPATPRTLTVANVDVNAASNAFLFISTAVAGGDPAINWQISATQNYAAGIDNSVAGDPWKLTNSSDPSSGDAIITSTSAGVLTLFNDLDVSEGGTGVSTLTSHGILMGNGAGDINATAEPTDGQLLIGKTGNFPVLASLTAGAGISVTGGSGTITIAATGGGLTWNYVTDATQALVADNGYLANRGTLITFTLPGTCAQFAEIKITGMSAGLWKIAQNANQMIHFGSKTTVTGVGGSVSSMTSYDSVTLRCTVADLEFVIETATGNLDLKV